MAVDTDDTSSPRRALALLHHDTTPPGLVGEWAQAQGFRVEQVRVDRGAPLPDPTRFQLVMSFGSGEAAYDDDVPWVPRELDHLRRATAEGVPVLGVCFGAQMLARALGGSVGKGPWPEIGWHEVTARAPERVGPGPWFGWHYDTFEPPAQAHVLAHNDTGCQAFELGPHLALQFHAEVTPAIVRSWVATWGAAQLQAQGLRADALLAETRARGPVQRQATHALLDAWAAAGSATGRHG